ncbi:helix-turn-helix domain-containing protein [Agromyces sp. Soil535]|uniref:winged helix-turn-helix transcriptional regulator n=1 Tax=Agromyces sp. Soil535 TaxID=1736390 RepID=UPI0006FCB104|nr:helix-turn-helix domain-containing protein [Agromyces sp. Soil535]KRE30392.1 HxlR family transcriptional regulator [Agromyces sp. Soil535]
MRQNAETAERCSIARSLEVLGQKWSVLVLREAILRGRTRFAEFRAELGVAPDVLTDRLARLVEAGILERRPYREAGERERVEYVLTEAGWALKPVLAAISAWGDEYRPSGFGPAAIYTERETGAPVRLAFLDGEGGELDPEDVVAVPGPGATVTA